MPRVLDAGPERELLFLKEKRVKLTPRQVIRWILALLMVGTFMIYLIRLDLSDPFQQRLGDLMIGALVGYVGSVMQKYFGEKDDA